MTCIPSSVFSYAGVSGAIIGAVTSCVANCLPGHKADQSMAKKEAALWSKSEALYEYRKNGFYRVLGSVLVVMGAVYSCAHALSCERADPESWIDCKRVGAMAVFCIGIGMTVIPKTIQQAAQEILARPDPVVAARIPRARVKQVRPR